MLAITLFVIIFCLLCLLSYDEGDRIIGTVDRSFYPCYTVEQQLQEAALYLELQSMLRE